MAKDLAPDDGMLDDASPDMALHGTNVAGIVAGTSTGLLHVTDLT